MMDQPECSKRNCKWFNGIRRADPNQEASERPVCVAFPEGIPDSIAYGTNKHGRKHPDQVGDYIYEPAAG